LFNTGNILEARSAATRAEVTSSIEEDLAPDLSKTRPKRKRNSNRQEEFDKGDSSDDESIDRTRHNYNATVPQLNFTLPSTSFNALKGRTFY
jgi:hypothetical protein